SLPPRRRRQRVAVGVQRLTQAAVAADLAPGFLIDCELLFVRDSGRCRASPAILREENGSLVQPRCHVVARQTRTTRLGLWIGTRCEENLDGLGMLLLDGPHQRGGAADGFASGDVSAGFEEARE